MAERIIPPHGTYKNLLCYRKAEIVYDLTVVFCHRFLSKRDRTIDQMVQAARSGKQNICEASQISAVSKEGELKLFGVARASLEELLNDYFDYLRTHNALVWDKHGPEAMYVRSLGANPRGSYADFRKIGETRDGPTLANVAIGLIRQANFLLDRLLRRLERDFAEQGGLRERMAAVRQEYRRRPAERYRSQGSQRS
jgi:four helix bundle suffix protein